MDNEPKVGDKFTLKDDRWPNGFRVGIGDEVELLVIRGPGLGSNLYATTNRDGRELTLYIANTRLRPVLKVGQIDINTGRRVTKDYAVCK